MLLFLIPETEINNKRTHNNKMKTLIIQNEYKSTINHYEMWNKHLKTSRIMHLRNVSVQSRSTRCQHASRKCEL